MVVWDTEWVREVFVSFAPLSKDRRRKVDDKKKEEEEDRRRVEEGGGSY